MWKMTKTAALAVGLAAAMSAQAGACVAMSASAMAVPVVRSLM